MKPRQACRIEGESTPVKDIVSWLEKVERKASDLYREASRRFSQDRPLADFLEQMSAEEDWHRRLIEAAAETVDRHALDEARVLLDAKTRETVEGPFQEAAERLAAGHLTRREMLETIAATEFSEWNDLFLYVMETLKGHSRDFQRAAAEIETHRQEILDFFQDTPGARDSLEKLSSLHPLWQRRILVVEDHPAFARLLQTILAQMGEVVIARDGAEGLEEIRRGFFDVIVSDVEMPVLNGVEMCRRSMAMDPEVRTRFIFYSGTRKRPHLDFFATEQIPHLPKPAPLNRIRQAVSEVFEHSRTAHAPPPA